MLIRYVHLIVLSTFALAQPLLDLLARSPQFFVIRRSQPGDIFLLAALLLFFIPTCCLLMCKIAQLFSKRFSDLLFNSVLLLLLSLITLPLSAKMFPGYIAVLISLIAAILFTVFYQKSTGIRTFLSFLSISILVVPYLFFNSVGIKEIVLGKKVDNLESIGGQAKNKYPVVMVIFDELPLTSLLNEKHEIDHARFPGFGAIAKRANWYRNATTLSSWTEHAVPIILSGRKPQNATQIPSFNDYPKNLFTLLSKSHEMNVYEQVTHLCADTLCVNRKQKEGFQDRFVSLILDASVIYLHAILPKEFKVNLPDISFAWGEFLQGKAPKFQANRKGLLDKGSWADDAWLFDEFLRSISNSTKPSLNFIHITFPHVPYRYLASGKKYFKNLDRRNDKGYKKRWDNQEWPTILQYQRYMSQLFVADKMLQKLVTKLESEEIFDQSLIVVVADHGTSFMTNEFSRRVTAGNAAEVMYVPLFIKLPSQSSPETIDLNVETIDILPSIATIMGFANADGYDGRSVFSSNLVERSQKEFYSIEGSKSESMAFSKSLDLKSAVNRHVNLFGSGTGAESIFRYSEQPDLIGKDVKSITERAQEVEEIIIESSEDYAKVDLNSDFIPAYITGEVKSKERKENGYLLVVSVNGSVRGVTRALLGGDGRYRFGSLIPENSFVQGENRVEVLAIQ